MDHSQHMNHADASRALTFSEKLQDAFSQYGFMPHGHCYLWKPLLVSVHVVSDFLIGTSYLFISILLYGLVKKINLSFNRVVICFGLFIAACGLTHFMEIWNLWHGDYWWAGWVKVVTAIASLGTAVYLFKLRNSIIEVAENVKLTEARKKELEELHLTNLAEIARMRDEFSILGDNISQLVWMAYKDGSIFWYNKRWYEYTGTTFEDMQGWGWEKVHDPNELPRVTTEWKKCLENGTPFDSSFPLRGKDGVYRWFLTRAMPIKDENGEIIRWFGTNTEIEEQRKNEEKLKELAHTLDLAVKSRDEFLSIASHELKTPLTTILIQTQFQKKMALAHDERAYSKERVNLYTDQNEKLVTRLNRIVDDMLDISRIRNGKLHLSNTEIDLHHVVQEVVERLQSQFKESGYEIPKITGVPTRGFFDQMRIEQVISNLLTNAIRYGNKKPIEVMVENLNGKGKITVRDQGMGIPQDKREKIFDRFERAVPANEVSGLGLGLFISKKIITAYDGKIWVEDNKNAGSDFIIELPLGLGSL